LNIKERMEEIIATEAAAISAIEITETFEAAVRLLMCCEGKIVTTGIGKAGYIAQKFAATMSSTGTPAFFLHPAEAGHGDLGILSEEDCIIAFSTSGKSNEVIEMLEMSRALGISKVIGITSHVDGPIRKLSDIVLDMGEGIEEACPLNITPSSTIAVMLAISDAIALTLMEIKGFTADQYHARHHKGYLGTVTRPRSLYANEE